MLPTAVKLRKPTAEENRKIGLIRLRANSMGTGYPYLASIHWKMQPIMAEGLGTFAVDSKWRVYIDPEMLKNEDLPQLTTAYLHEAGHCRADHVNRLSSASPSDINTIAKDMELNQHLRDDGHVFPFDDQVYFPSTMNLEPYLTAEEYYKLLRDQQSTGKDQGDGGKGDEDGPMCQGGSGAGKPLPFESQADGITPGVTEMGQEVAQQIAAKETAEFEKMHGIGSVPDSLKVWANEKLKKPETHWTKKVLSRIKSTDLSSARKVRHTLRRPNRRQGNSRIIMPSLRAPLPTIFWATDTSASMGGSGSRVKTELNAILKQVKSRKLYTLSIDAEAHGKPVPVKSLSQVEFNGGGGTYMQPAFDAAEKLKDLDLMVLATDGGILESEPWLSWDAPSYRVVILQVGSYHAVEYPSWVDLIEVKE